MNSVLVISVQSAHCFVRSLTRLINCGSGSGSGVSSVVWLSVASDGLKEKELDGSIGSILSL